MNEIIKPGSAILFMKVGTHAQETLDDIIERKTKEIEQAGYALWGYGGNTCHPQAMVQPFGKTFDQKGQVIHLCMQPMLSNHFADPIRADEVSYDGQTWEPIPNAINVLGSRYALVIENLKKQEFDLPLYQTTVAVGPSMGRSGDRYIKGRVDKACLEIVNQPVLPNSDEKKIIRIGLVAELRAPFAGYVRNKAA
jgi:hypothetical protein